MRPGSRTCAGASRTRRRSPICSIGAQLARFEEILEDVIEFQRAPAALAELSGGSGGLTKPGSSPRSCSRSAPRSRLRRSPSRSPEGPTSTIAPPGTRPTPVRRPTSAGRPCSAAFSSRPCCSGGSSPGCLRSSPAPAGSGRSAPSTIGAAFPPGRASLPSAVRRSSCGTRGSGGTFSRRRRRSRAHVASGSSGWSTRST